MKFRKKIAFFMLIVMLVLNTITVQAQKSDNQDDINNDNRQTSTVSSFSDVPANYWAHDAIMLMANYSIITGYNDGTFRPDASVSKSEFAKMMVLTMQMELINPSTASFLDVQKGGWDYKYIETAKPYMTAYKTSEGLNFRPLEGAQREDMAVAVVKGLALPPSTDLSILNNLTDSGSISTQLKGYVATAMANNIMIGDDNKKFNPKSTITRAQTATLLARLIKDEKIVFDEEKVVVEDNQTTKTKTPVLEATVVNQKLVLDWKGVDPSGFSYYKVVLSKSDATPTYPDNGYATAISNVGTTLYEISAGDGYNGGDFGGTLQAGTYYATITAVFGDTKSTSNVVVVTIPEKSVVTTSGRTPGLSSSGIVDGGIKLTWTKTENNDNFQYYKVVLSKTNSKPSYPNDGYVTYISDNNINYYIIKAGQEYQGGNISKLEGAHHYYVAVTAVYSNGNQYNTSNVLTVQLP